MEVAGWFGPSLASEYAAAAQEGVSGMEMAALMAHKGADADYGLVVELVRRTEEVLSRLRAKYPSADHAAALVCISEKLKDGLIRLDPRDMEALYKTFVPTFDQLWDGAKGVDD